ncbi:Transmembrane protein 234 [Oryzias melastigma]|uniref:Transmembrane protein 234 n=1 Tax=Oryzias melastigma TaxID=30732 RepID=A0A3B3DD31_ORYME|nr:transmembrane protein 234 isoform X1 [Oryzias melastigma]KAF6721814.1 Transmembrane protein 234 [Oryzias melastigma]
MVPPLYLRELVSLVVVSVLWGCTNPFLKRGTEGLEKVTQPNRVSQILAEIKFLFMNFKYLVPFLINQAGSVFYYYTLSTTDLSLAVPVTNSLTLLCTLLTGKLLGEELGGKNAVLGMILTVTGVSLCIISSVDDVDINTQNAS